MSEKLTEKENRLQAIKFACFSASAGVIQVVSFTILNTVFEKVPATNDFTKWLFQSEYGVPYLIALILSVLWNFTINRKFTFKSATNIPIAMLKVFGYYCVFTPLSVWLGDGTIARNGWGGTWREYIVLGVTMIINMVTEFLFCRFVVYRNSMNTNDVAQKDAAKKADE